MDIFSRKIVGRQVDETESSELASEVMRDICDRENIARNQVVLHSDNGAPMKGATMLATLQALGVMPSFIARRLAMTIPIANPSSRR